MAQRKTNPQLTPLELELMQVLWRNGPATVHAVQAGLERRLAYTTVQTMLNLLNHKQKVKRALKDRAYVYAAAVSRDHEVGKTMSDIIDRLFGGSAENLVMSLVETRKLTPAKLSRLHRLIDSQSRSPQPERRARETDRRP